MRYIFIFIMMSVSLLAQEQVDPLYVQQTKNDPQYGANIRKAEQVLNQNILKVNESLVDYSNILFLKMSSLPHRTLVTKGTAKGDDCISNANQDESGDCLKVEQFDFVEGEKGEAKGPKSKSMTLFFDFIYKTEGDKKILSEIKLLKVKSRIFSHNLFTTDKKVVEVLDTDPLGNPDHDNKIFITNQIDNYPANANTEIQGDRGIGKYRLNSIENTKSNPLRNHFKREAYIKHLLSFEKTLSKILNYNESAGNKKVKDNAEFLKNSMKY